MALHISWSLHGRPFPKSARIVVRSAAKDVDLNQTGRASAVVAILIWINAGRRGTRDAPAMIRHALLALLVLASLASAVRADPPRPGGHYADHRNGWVPHQPWHPDFHRFDHERWRAGHWWHGTYGGRYGAWWIVGPDWYWYPSPTYPYPDPYVPFGYAPGFWYWCDAAQQYYPYVGACASPWRAVPPS